jgi:acetyltransferase-like isoleucine patch superfamily enzyme
MISWNSTLIDSDEHNPVLSSGRILKLQKRPLVVGERVGMQANVLIPRGVNIGNLSVISAGTVLREDVPPEVFVYTDQKLRKKEGLTSGIK